MLFQVSRLSVQVRTKLQSGKWTVKMSQAVTRDEEGYLVSLNRNKKVPADVQCIH